jgi:prepilin-type N-terminal cleavage/methylation domain-containing protein
MKYLPVKTSMPLKCPCFPAIGKSGFSLLELVVGLAVAAIAMLAVTSVFTTLTRSYTTQTASAGLQQAARGSLDYMVQNIRMAGLNPGRIADVGILAADATSLEFNLDRNLNGILETTDEEHMRFSFDAADREVDEELYIGTVSESKGPLVGDVTNLTFNYFDRNGDPLGPTPEVEDIKIVQIFLTVQQRPGRERRPLIRTYSSRVICRNLGL